MPAKNSKQTQTDVSHMNQAGKGGLVGSVRSIFCREKIHFTLDTLDLNLNLYKAQWSMTVVSEHSELFEHLFSERSLKGVADIDDYYYFLLTRKVAKLGEFTGVLDQDKADLVKKLADAARPVFKSNTKSAIDFTNDHPLNIFSHTLPACVQNKDLKNGAVDFIIDMQNSINEPVFKCMCEECPGEIIGSYSELNKVFDKNTDLFSKLFPSGSLQYIKSLGLKDVLDIWSNKHNYQKHRQYIDNLVDQLCQDAESDLSEKPEDILEKPSVLSALTSFLQKINSPKANGFEEKIKSAEEAALSCLQNLGCLAKFSIRIPKLSAAKQKASSGSKLLSLTHCSIPGDDNEYESFLSRSPGNFPIENLVTQLPNGGANSSDIKYWQILEGNETQKFYSLLGDEKEFYEYAEGVKSEIRFISEQLERTGNGLEEDTAFLFGMLEAVSEAAQHSHENEASCYSSSMFMCSAIEKIMRLSYVFMAQDEQYVSENITLGNLLDSNNRYLTELFGQDHLQSIAYFLIKTPQIKNGRNCRNELAHWASGMKPKTMTACFTAKLLWLFTDVVNTVYLYFDKQKNFGDTHEISVSAE